MLQLRPYQTEGLDALYNYFASGQTGNPLLAWPTGTGKSIVPAVFIQKAMELWPTQRFLMVTHVKELIDQNAKELKGLWPTAPLGIYSAGLKQKDIGYPIIYGGIQSMIKNPDLFGFRNIMFVDEAHLISTNDASMYQTFIKFMKIINPKLRVIGLTATPYRMGQGYVTDGGIFTDIVHDITSMEAFNKLIEEGYLANLIARPMQTEIKAEGVGVQNGDYVQSQLQAAVDKHHITFAAIKELLAVAGDRKSWLIFAAGIEHAEHIATMLHSYGIEGEAVHSKRSDNDDTIRRFRDGELRFIVNYGKLTTGFNHKPIDLIGMFRPTLSVPLWVQMLGRGTRPYPGKSNCLVLDFARNAERLGPINDPRIPRKKSAEIGDMPIKICPSCGVYNHPRVRFCVSCGEEFPVVEKIEKKADFNAQIIKTEQAQIESFQVDWVTHTKKQKAGGKPYIKIDYFCGRDTFTERIFPEGKGLAHKNYVDWWRQRHKDPPPDTTEIALMYNSDLRKPKQVQVQTNLPVPIVLRAIF